MPPKLSWTRSGSLWGALAGCPHPKTAERRARLSNSTTRPASTHAAQTGTMSGILPANTTWPSKKGKKISAEPNQRNRRRK